ncbi:MAG: hypothetical protein WD278_09335, partial [Pirellulales bacterium]
RNLQRIYQKRLADVALGNTYAPEDCRTVAHSELQALEGRIQGQLANAEVKLDTYTKAHLQESSAVIRKVLESRLITFGP